MQAVQAMHGRGAMLENGETRSKLAAGKLGAWPQVTECVCRGRGVYPAPKDYVGRPGGSDPQRGSHLILTAFQQSHASC